MSCFSRTSRAQRLATLTATTVLVAGGSLISSTAVAAAPATSQLNLIG